jgi:hypothetical protein
MPEKQKPKPIKPVTPPSAKKPKKYEEVGEFDVDDLMKETDPDRKKRMLESGAVSTAYSDLPIIGGIAQLGRMAIPAIGSALTRFLGSHPNVARSVAITGPMMDLMQTEEGMPTGGTSARSSESALDLFKDFGPKTKVPPPPITRKFEKMNEGANVADIGEFKAGKSRLIDELEATKADKLDEAMNLAQDVKQNKLSDLRSAQRDLEVERNTPRNTVSFPQVDSGEGFGKQADDILAQFKQKYPDTANYKLKYSASPDREANKGRLVFQTEGKVNNPFTEGFQSRTQSSLMRDLERANTKMIKGKAVPETKVLGAGSAKDRVIPLTTEERNALKSMIDVEGKIPYDPAKHKVLWQNGFIKVQGNKITGVTDAGIKAMLKKK